LYFEFINHEIVSQPTLTTETDLSNDTKFYCNSKPSLADTKSADSILESNSFRPNPFLQAN
jgi:hypothetical protein